MLTPMPFAGKGKLPSRLAEIFDKLGEEERRSLLDFAEFLLQRSSQTGAEADEAAQPLEPAEHPRPESETVVAAIKRLTATYHMLDRQALFSKTSELMSAHILQGRDAADVIDELETVFSDYYRKYLDGFKR
jgi:hypothetical protein